MILNILLAIKMLKKLDLYVCFFQKWVHYCRDFDKTKCKSFFIKDEKFLEKYNEIWEKVCNIIQKEFDSFSACNEKYINIKIKYCNGKINATFHKNKIPKEGSEYVCLSVILLDLVYKKDRNFYPQVFSEECKYVIKEKKEFY